MVITVTAAHIEESLSAAASGFAINGIGTSGNDLYCALCPVALALRDAGLPLLVTHGGFYKGSVRSENLVTLEGLSEDVSKFVRAFDRASWYPYRPMDSSIARTRALALVPFRFEFDGTGIFDADTEPTTSPEANDARS